MRTTSSTFSYQQQDDFHLANIKQWHQTNQSNSTEMKPATPYPKINQQKVQLGTRKSRTALFPKGFGSSLATTTIWKLGPSLFSEVWELLQTQCPVDATYDRESVTKQFVKYSFDQRKAAFDAGAHLLPSRISKSKVCKH